MRSDPSRPTTTQSRGLSDGVATREERREEGVNFASCHRPSHTRPHPPLRRTQDPDSGPSIYLGVRTWGGPHGPSTPLLYEWDVGIPPRLPWDQKLLEHLYHDPGHE